MMSDDEVGELNGDRQVERLGDDDID